MDLSATTVCDLFILQNIVSSEIEMRSRDVILSPLIHPSLSFSRILYLARMRQTSFSIVSEWHHAQPNENLTRQWSR